MESCPDAHGCLSNSLILRLLIADLTIIERTYFHQQKQRHICQSQEKSTLTIAGGGDGKIKWRQPSPRHQKRSLFIKNSNRCHTGFWEAKQMTGYWAVNSTADDGRLAICPQCVRAPVALAWFEMGFFWECPIKGSSGMERDSSATPLHSILVSSNAETVQLVSSEVWM